MFGAIEAGGTKWLCAIGTSPSDLGPIHRIPTTDPESTVSEVIRWFQSQKVSLSGVGIGCFGPIERTPAHPLYGRIGQTPKMGWSGTDVLTPLTHGLGCPVVLDTDVNAAALGEGTWGACRGLERHVYVTVGTGIGGGTVIAGQN